MRTLLDVVQADCERDGAFPEWAQRGPVCAEEKCSSYDGKRCRLTGFRPDGYCEPAVERMQDELMLHQVPHPSVPQRGP